MQLHKERGTEATNGKWQQQEGNQKADMYPVPYLID